ncbi:hypothetical protein [Loktanella sp. 3ANDIMAR09]|uniref:hypothetical protein n=1 Tax=Loktanella sp. 3ANDIMAR09 TaxID=1225657 RepID=UPI0006FCAA60|nr:hypothetical protein [Loktanella sp. 3ANDIMAR09]
MSFARWALRRTALKAMQGKTIVADNVLDSDFSALTFGADGDARSESERPFILIYTDDSEAQGVETRSLRQNGMVDFVCEFGLATPMFEVDPDTGGTIISGINVPLTDATMEATLDLIDADIVRALTANDEWADLWRGLSNSVSKIKRVRTTTVDQGIRLAARQIRVTLDVLPDPIPGQPIAAASIWRRVSDAIRQDEPALGPVADRFMVASGGPIDEVVSQGLGLSRVAADRLGVLNRGDETIAITEPDGGE